MFKAAIWLWCTLIHRYLGQMCKQLLTQSVHALILNHFDALDSTCLSEWLWLEVHIIWEAWFSGTNKIQPATRTKEWMRIMRIITLKWLVTQTSMNGENISFIRIEKSLFSRWRRNSKADTSSGSHRKNQTRGDKKQKNTHRYEQKCQDTCSGTINSSMYDSDLTITTSPLTSSAPYSG